MTASVPEPVMAIARAEARLLAAGGARAVVLTGSYAGGTPLPHADIDLVALGDGPHYRLCRRDGYLVATSWRSERKVREAFSQPGDAPTVVPGWRDAVILLDPEGVAARLKAEAAAWDWSLIAEACDRRVANEAVGYAEEVQKLVGALEAGRPLVAAVQRSVIALRLPGLLAIHRRLLYGSENRLWELMAEREGDPWATAHARALGVEPCNFEESCRAALDLYLLYIEAVRDLLTDGESLAVIDAACDLVRRAKAR